MPLRGTLISVDNDGRKGSERTRYLGVRVQVGDDLTSRDISTLGVGVFENRDELVLLFTPNELKNAIARAKKPGNQAERKSLKGGIWDLFD